jgi:hypothetical protein
MYKHILFIHSSIHQWTRQLLLLLVWYEHKCVLTYLLHTLLAYISRSGVAESYGNFI